MNVFLDIARPCNLESAARAATAASPPASEKFVPAGRSRRRQRRHGADRSILEATSELSTLLDFKYKRSYKAGNGQPGGGQRRTGADGEDVILKVPLRHQRVQRR